MNIYEKLLNIQNELKAPKNQYNSFGKYNYRSCEDILEAAKPICYKYKAVLILGDEIVVKGEGITQQQVIKDDGNETTNTIVTRGQRFYVKATATLYDIEKEGSFVSNSADAREEFDKKGMDGSQITGTASSYARKYALSGLFNLDDTRDADTDEFQKQTKQVKEDDTITKAQADALNDLVKNKGVEKDTALAVMSEYGYKKMSEIKQKDYMTIKVQLETGRKN